MIIFFGISILQHSWFFYIFLWRPSSDLVRWALRGVFIELNLRQHQLMFQTDSPEVEISNGLKIV